VAKDGGIVVTCLGQLDTYGPLCDDAAKVYRAHIVYNIAK
jgi:hypothetical protein